MKSEIESAEELYDVGNHALALPIFEKLANSGVARAQYLLAKIYNSGILLPRDDAVALRWFSEAAQQGDVNSAFNLAQMFLGGEGTVVSYDKAYFWLRRARDLGDEESAEQINDLEAGIKDETGNLYLVINGCEFEDIAGALIEAAGEMTEDDVSKMLASVLEGRPEIFQKAVELTAMEGRSRMSVSIVADVLDVSDLYNFIADVYEYKQLHLA